MIHRWHFYQNLLSLALGINMIYISINTLIQRISIWWILIIIHVLTIIIIITWLHAWLHAWLHTWILRMFRIIISRWIWIIYMTAWHVNLGIFLMHQSHLSSIFLLIMRIIRVGILISDIDKRFIWISRRNRILMISSRRLLNMQIFHLLFQMSSIVLESTNFLLGRM